MRLDKNSLRFRLSVPVIIVSIFFFLLIYMISSRLFSIVLNEYHQFYISRYSFEIKKIFEKAVTELTTSQLLGIEEVVEAKKLDVIEEIRLYWLNNDFQGIIKKNDEIIYSSLKTFSKDFILSALKDYNPSFKYRGRYYYIFSIDFLAWDLQVITLAEMKEIGDQERQIRRFIYLLLLAFIFLIAGFFYILQRGLSPITNIVKDINDRKDIRKTSITELDLIGGAINESIRKLTKKTLQFQTLHNIALSMNEYDSIDDLMNIIIQRSIDALNCSYGAIVLYDERGYFKKIIAKGPDLNMNKIPQGKGILELVRLSISSFRIDDVFGHPAFSGSFPEGHPIIRNLLACPIFSEDRPVGALYFGNKEGGFSEEDEVLLKAISADTSIAINRVERSKELKQYQKIIESAFDVIVITDKNGYITYANPAFETITGYLRKDVIGKKPNILKSGYHDKDFYKNLWDTITAGKVWQGEFVNRKKNGEIYYESAIIFPIYFEEELYFVAIKRDITTEKKLYEQLLRAQKMEAIGTLAGGIAHDFNNLLTAVLGYSEIMLGRLKEGDPFYKPVNIIYNAAERGAELARKILTITRKEKMEMKLTDINEIVHNCIELLHRSIPKNIEIVTNLKKDLPKFMADPSQIQQIVMNLAVNASDAMPNGGKLTIETSLVGSENGAANGIPIDSGGFIKLSVSDTGVGMDKETQKKIFDPFFTTKETGRGTGLGLYIVHSVVSNHKGYINVYSEKDKGTRFNIYLPITKGTEAQEEEQEIDLRGLGTIMVIDDEENMRELCKDILEPLGYNVILCPDGEEGIKVFRQMKDNISVVLLDMIMPKLSGSEVFQTLRLIKPDVKVILCSGYSHEGFVGIDRLLKSGAKGFIQKPFTAKTLATTIKNILQKEK